MTSVAVALGMALAASATGSNGAGEKGAVVDEARVVFWTHVFEGHLSSWFRRSGPSGAELTGLFRNCAEIGWYQADWGREPYDALRALKEKAGFDALAPGPPIQPGMGTVDIGETEDGVTFDTKGWPFGLVPGPVQPLVDEAVRRTEALFAHPRCVVRGSGAATAATFGVAAPLAFHVTMNAVGTEPFRMGNPLAVKDTRRWMMRLLVMRDVPSPEDDEVCSVDLRPADLHPAIAKASRADDVKLAPGDKIEFTVRRKVRAGTGRYRALLLFYAPDGEGLDWVGGQLRIDLGAFEVHGHAPGGR